LQELRSRTGRPHWVAAENAHEVFPRTWVAEGAAAALVPRNLLLVTSEPEALSPAVLAAVTTAVAAGDGAPDAMARLAHALGWAEPETGLATEPDQALVAQRGGTPFRVAVEAPRSERRRAKRGLVDGDLGPERSFYFRGPQERLNLRAQNLKLFLELGEGVDTDTWQHHRDRGDYSRWIREATANDALADEVAGIERDRAPVDVARARLRRAVERFTAS
jgi:hypothetical protein